MSCSYQDKVIPYIIRGNILKEEVGKNKFHICSTKQEIAFLKFKDFGSIPNKLCDLAVKDSLIRLLFFQDFKVSFRPSLYYPVLIEYPLFLKYDESFVKMLINGQTFEKEIENMKRQKDIVSEDLQNVCLNAFTKLLRMIGQNPEFQQKLKGGRLRPEDIDEMFSKIISKHDMELLNDAQKLIEALSRVSAVFEYYLPTLEAIDSLKIAIDNMKRFCYATDIKNVPAVLFDSLSKMSKILPIRTNSICLECVLRRGSAPPYSVEERYPGRPALPEKCEKCSGETIYHKITIEIPPSIVPLFTQNLLSEFIIGYSLGQIDRIKKVYIHKKVSPIKDGQVMQGRQIDIFAITKDEKILIVEVTTQSDWNNIMHEEREKEERVREIPHDYFIYVTAALDSHERYITLPNRAFIFHSAHIPKIENYVEEIVLKSKS